MIKTRHLMVESCYMKGNAIPINVIKCNIQIKSHGKLYITINTFIYVQMTWTKYEILLTE